MKKGFSLPHPVLGDLDGRVGKEDISRPTMWKGSVHEVRSKDNMKMQLGETGWGGMDQMDRAQDRDERTAE
jgi:hypothetical protein